MANKKSTKKEKPLKFPKRAENFVEGSKRLMKKHSVSLRAGIKFPGKASIPLRGKMGIWLLQNSGGTVDIELLDNIANNKE